MAQTVTIKRKTSETDITVSLNLYGKGVYKIQTGISFLDHMLSLFAKHGLFDLKITAKGDLDVDIHHTNEDVGIALGEAFAKALKNKAGIKRFGEAVVPMDEALARVVIDISGRPFLDFKGAAVLAGGDEKYSLSDAQQFCKAFVDNTDLTMHIDILKAGDLHHMLEAVFKAAAKALLRAVEKEPRAKGVPSTKGKI
jgi:imidazoleglycerol-phosphate dehydratase